MPSRKADQIEPGVVLVDPSGELYEVVHWARVRSEIVMWLWKDDDPRPTWFQVFDPDEEINFIKQGPSTARHVAEESASEITEDAEETGV
jgi:hypothetical protein